MIDRRRFLAGSAASLIAGRNTLAQEPTRRKMSNNSYRIVYNDDGDAPVLLSSNLEHFLELAIDRFMDTQVDALFWNVIASDVLLYPTKVGEMVGSQRQAFDSAQYFQFYQKLLAIVEERQDYLQAMADRARAVGLEFFPSLRMNDCHDSPVWRAVDTFSQYRKDHSELLLGDSVHPGFSTGFDFAFPEVRERQAQDRRRAHVHLEVLDGVSAPGATSSDGNQPPSDPPCYPESPPQWTRDGRGGPAPTRLWHRSLIGIALLASCGATCEKQVREPDSSQSFRGNQP